jgi:hypothetical protein
MKSRRRVNSAVMRVSLSLLFFLILAVPAVAQQSNAPEYTHLNITMSGDGAHCGCVFFPGEEVSCCPNYSVGVDENGTVIFNGASGAKVRGEKIYSISVSAVRELVAKFFQIDFFSLRDRYESKDLGNGYSQSADHAYATTISIDIDGKKKSVYLFYGVPDSLVDLQRKLYVTLQVAQYTGRA